MRAPMLPATHPCGARVLLDLARWRWVDPTTSRLHKCGVEPTTGMAEDDPRHGSENGYNNIGCRCAACTKAHADYYRRRNRAAKAGRS